MKKNKAILKNELKVLTLWNTETYKVTETSHFQSMLYWNKDKQTQEIASLTQKFRNVYTHMHTHIHT